MDLTELRQLVVALGDALGKLEHPPEPQDDGPPAPVKYFKTSQRRVIMLRGDVFACLEYAALTGEDLRDAALRLWSQPGKGNVGAFRDPVAWANFLWAFSASWREDEGFSRKYSSKQEERRAFLALFTPRDLERSRAFLQDLVVATLTDPTQAASPISGEAADTPGPSTGITPTGPDEPDTVKTGDSSPDSTQPTGQCCSEVKS